jgi:hypothetical protein
MSKRYLQPGSFETQTPFSQSAVPGSTPADTRMPTQLDLRLKEGYLKGRSGKYQFIARIVSFVSFLPIQLIFLPISLLERAKS